MREIVVVVRTCWSYSQRQRPGAGIVAPDIDELIRLRKAAVLGDGRGKDTGPSAIEEWRREPCAWG